MLSGWVAYIVTHDSRVTFKICGMFFLLSFLAGDKLLSSFAVFACRISFNPESQLWKNVGQDKMLLPSSLLSLSSSLS